MNKEKNFLTLFCLETIIGELLGVIMMWKGLPILGSIVVIFSFVGYYTGIWKIEKIRNQENEQSRT